MIKALKDLYGKLSLNRKINFFVLLITTTITLITGIFSYSNLKSMAFSIIGEDTVKIADSIAAGVNGDRIQYFSQTTRADDSWNELTKSLSIIKARTGADFIYIMADGGDKYKYIADGHVEGRSDDITKLGDTDEKSIYGPEPQYVLNSGKSKYTDIYNNGTYGKLISGFTPIKNSKGKTVAVLGVDISANEAIASINSYIPQMALLLVLCEIFLFMLLSALLKRIIIRPLKQITVLEENIAAGNDNIHIEEKYLQHSDEIGDMFNGFKTMSNTYQLLLKEISNLALQHREGNTDVFISEEQFNGIYKEVVCSINSMAKDYFSDIVKAVGYLDNISDGDFDAELEHFPGQKVFINEKIDLLKANLKRITVEMKDLVTNAINGNLQSRVDVKKFNGDWQKLMILLNNLLDAVIEPIIESSKVLNELADGNIGIQVAGDYKGDYVQIKDSLNKLTIVIGNMTHDVKAIAASTIDGNLTVRADAGKYCGEYRKIVEYMNNTVDAVQKPISLIKNQLDRMAAGLPTEKLDADFNGTYADLILSINALTESLSIMLNKTNSLMTAAQKGDLAYRADIAGLKGKYAEIVLCINQAMDAIIRPIEEISDVIKEIAKGNLNVKVKGSYQGNITSLKENVNLTVDTLNEIIKSISDYTENIAMGNINLEELEAYSGDYNKISLSLNAIVSSLNHMLRNIWYSSEQIAAGSQQIAEGSCALSTGASQQASSVEQLTASISEITSQTESNSYNAVQAGKLANIAKEEAETGNDKMVKMLGAMSEINESSQSITKIIKTIDDIAFQTNILALNASVEAARAGQYGKGFAVVAEEVRNLATKSAKAAKDTDELIGMSNNKVKQGSDIASEMAVSLQTMHETIKKVDTLVSNIVIASNEQTTGIDQINKGIKVVSSVVQTNAGTSEESAASSEELSNQAEALKEMVSKFKLK